MGIVYLAALAAAVLMLRYIIRHLRKGGGCCGAHEAPAKHIRAADRDRSHYPYHYTVQIAGMVCGNCAKRVENLFNETGSCLAKADLADKSAVIHTKQRMTRTECAEMLDQIGFTLIDIRQHRAKPA